MVFDCCCCWEVGVFIWLCCGPCTTDEGFFCPGDTFKPGAKRFFIISAICEVLLVLLLLLLFGCI